MSVINAVHMGEYALVSADTDAVFSDGSRGNISKLLTIPHLNAVIAVRGSLGFLQKAHAEFSTMPSFDQMIERAELILLYALAQQGNTDGLDDYAKGAEMILSGYSEQSSKVVINVFRCKSFGDEVEAYMDVSNALFPGDLGISLEGITASREGLIELTGRQVSAIREKHPNAAAGGKLLIAEIHPHRVCVESAARFS